MDEIQPVLGDFDAYYRLNRGSFMLSIWLIAQIEEMVASTLCSVGVEWKIEISLENSYRTAFLLFVALPSLLNNLLLAV